MKLPLERLGDSPSPFSFEAGPAWWQSQLPDAGELAGALRFRLQAHRMGEDLYLEGSVEGELELECSRCLARYRHGLAEPFRLVLEPAGSRLPADPESSEALLRDGLCLGEEVETGWYQGSELDLGPFFREVVALALPVKPLCGEGCAGLCPRCGVDRNRDACDCRDIEKVSPFAVLRTLREGGSEGES